MRIILKKVFSKISYALMSLFYDKKYLTGVWFLDDETMGWKWAWRCFFDQKLKGYNKHIPFPVNPTTTIGSAENLEFDVDNIDNFWKTACYYQNYRGKIRIGRGTWIVQGVGIITENHNLTDLTLHDDPKDVVIGEQCWIGMNSVILPGVYLGNHTIVGAGSVVTKSYPDGNCVIAGNPARVIRNL